MLRLYPFKSLVFFVFFVTKFFFFEVLVVKISCQCAL